MHPQAHNYFDPVLAIVASLASLSFDDLAHAVMLLVGVIGAVATLIRLYWDWPRHRPGPPAERGSPEKP